ncbi:MAG: universal stress protein [Sulfuritalea sp.]|jgi:nucleotide-binding universal stress UspA family protein|nr:universal stress protein [Sulfuritalea sp.]
MDFGNIVVAVDGSEASQDALSHAVSLASQGNTTLTGIFVIDSQWADFIGNDWQSSKGARQGFLDYIRKEQEEQAEAARTQFEQATQGMEQAAFSVHAGDPTAVLLEQASCAGTGMLVTGRRVFQISGRPSLKALAVTLAKRASRPLLLFP